MLFLIDTNVLISAVLFPDSVPAKAFFKAVTPPHSAVVCEYSLDEMRRVYNRKFPHRIQDFERFIAMLALSVQIIPVPPVHEKSDSEQSIRDVNDLPIFRAAVAAKVDGIITGDKDFLESGITNPMMIPSAAFLRMKDHQEDR